MSDSTGILQALGSLELGGMTYLVEPVALRHFATFSKFVEDWFAKNGDSVMDGPLASVINDPSWAALTPEEKKTVLTAFGANLASQPKRKKLSDEEVEERTKTVMRTVEGTAYFLWILVKKHHPKVTYEQLIEPVREATPEHVQIELRRAASFEAFEAMIKRQAGDAAKN